MKINILSLGKFKINQQYKNLFEYYRKRIRIKINLVEIKNKDVIEIGPGKASLTEEIIKNNPRSLSLIEKDNNLAEKLRLRFLKNKNIIV